MMMSPVSISTQSAVGRPSTRGDLRDRLLPLVDLGKLLKMESANEDAVRYITAIRVGMPHRWSTQLGALSAAQNPEADAQMFGSFE